MGLYRPKFYKMVLCGIKVVILRYMFFCCRLLWSTLILTYRAGKLVSNEGQLADAVKLSGMSLLNCNTNCKSCLVWKSLSIYSCFWLDVCLQDLISIYPCLLLISPSVFMMVAFLTATLTPTLTNPDINLTLALTLALIPAIILMLTLMLSLH